MARLIAAMLLLMAASTHGRVARLDPVAGAVTQPARKSSTPSPPTWAPAYIVEFVVSMPSDYLMQPQGFNIPVKAWFDAPAVMSRVESYGGIDTVLTVEGSEYSIHPRIDRLKCWAFANDDEALKKSSIKPVLPDIRKWVYGGDVTLDGREAHTWRLEFRQGEQVSTYNFYTAAADGAPLKLHMFGRNIIEDSHFDEYLYEYTSYTPFPSGSKPEAFRLPDLCSPSQAEVATVRHWLARSMGMLASGTHSGSAGHGAAAHASAKHWSDEAAHAHWSAASGRAPAGDETEHRQRLDRFRRSVERVAAHNAQPDKAYTMQLGRFADWSDEEYYGVLMPDVWRRKQGLPSGREARMAKALDREPHAYRPLGKFKRRMKDSELPKHVDWRGTGADAGIKDQGFCGSCWTFAATGAMEGAWFLATGEQRRFSEQQIVDCSWTYGVDGCDGGDAEPAINMIARSGGVALEQDYYYEGMDGYCRANNHTRVGKFEGFLKVESRDELALMEAVYTMGPVAVGVDASLDSFGYYKEGVFRESSCSTTDLDHAVVLYGYGTTKDGVDYWLVKNSWSKLWGEEGMIKIARGSLDCGIATEATIAVVAKQAQQAQSLVAQRLHLAVKA